MFSFNEESQEKLIKLEFTFIQVCLKKNFL